MNGTYLSALLFLIIGVLSSLYLLLEAVLQAFGRSICPTEGCKVVAQSTRFGDLTMVLLGLGTVVLITVLAARVMRTASAGRDRVINFLLITSLAGEGFFVGYQLFRLNAVCIFCLSVFGIFVILGALRVLAGHREVLAGFGALLAVLSLFYLVLPGGGTALPLDQRYVLFYSPDCRHCTEIRKEMEASGIAFRHVEVKDYAATLKSMGIEHVPTLLVNGPQEKYFLTGVEAIRRHLLPAPAPKPAKKQRPEVPPRKGEAVMPAGRFELFAPGANPAFDPLPDAGLCKENVKCD
jgi:glutaredoxin/uncharacterized membrane protein